MKSSMLTIVSLAAGITGSAHASPVQHSRVIRDETTMIAIPLNDERVFCTDLGYSNVQLKISVEDLEWLAALDHRVEGETLPCMAGGMCEGPLTEFLGIDGLSPSDFLSSGPSVEVTPLRVVLTENLYVDQIAKTCTRSLEEMVTADIQGHPFAHYAYDFFPESVPFDVCEAIIELP